MRTGDYTMREALADARGMLKDEFGDVDQRAAVELASILHNTKVRDEFLEREGGGAGAPYGF